MILISPVPILSGFRLEKPLQLWESCKALVHFQFFWGLLFWGVNAWMFFHFGMNTFLTVKILFWTYVLAAGCSFGMFKIPSFPLKIKSPLLMSSCLPFILSLGLLINYSFASNFHQETFPVKALYAPFGVRAEYHSVAVVSFQEDELDAYGSIRTLLFTQTFEPYDSISYTFADGLLGLKVSIASEVKEK